MRDTNDGDHGLPPLLDWVCLIMMIVVMVVALYVGVRAVHARDLGQWDGTDPPLRARYRGLMQPDAPAPQLPPGVTCEQIRAMVAEHGKPKAIAWALRQGYSWAEIIRAASAAACAAAASRLARSCVCFAISSWRA